MSSANAVRLVVEDGEHGAIARVADRLDINRETLRNWVNAERRRTDQPEVVSLEDLGDLEGFGQMKTLQNAGQLLLATVHNLRKLALHRDKLPPDVPEAQRKHLHEAQRRRSCISGPRRRPHPAPAPA